MIRDSEFEIRDFSCSPLQDLESRIPNLESEIENE